MSENLNDHKIPEKAPGETPSTSSGERAESASSCECPEKTLEITFPEENGNAGTPASAAENRNDTRSRGKTSSYRTTLPLIQQSKCDTSRTMRIDTLQMTLERTAAISVEKLKTQTQTKTLDGQHEKTRSTTRTSSFITDTLNLKKRKDVDSVIESHREQRPRQDVTFEKDQTEVKLHSLDADYESGTVFASGGQGILSMGTDKKLQRLVAIKSLREELIGDERHRKFFLAEAKVTAQLDHPSIVPIYTLNSDAGNGLHLAMKLVNGENFKNYLAQIVTHYRLDGIQTYNESKSLRYRLEVFLKVCDALEYAHSRNIMHCDLKPENIMIGEYHETYVMDWGIARLIHEPGYDPAHWTRPESIAGTPRYLSPEAINGEHCDQRADIFTMGIILFESVTLKEAFVAASPEEVMQKIRDGEMEEITHRFDAPIDRDLKAIIKKASATDRELRYQHIEELATDLRHYLQGLEVSANPDNLFMKLVRCLSKHKKAVVIGMLSILLIWAAALVYSFYRNYQFSETARKKEYSLTLAYSIAANAGYELDKQFARLEQNACALASQIAVMQTNLDKFDATGLEGKAFFIPDLKRKNSPSMMESSFHGGFVDYNALSYNVAADTDMTTLTARLNSLFFWRDCFLRTILESPRNVKMNLANKNELIQSSAKEGTPVIRVIVGLKDGLYAAFPGSGQFPSEYDPRKRTWYRIAEKLSPGERIWTEPYIDSIPNFGLVLSCSVPLFDSSEHFLGVMALDISLSELIEGLRSSGNSGDYVLEKAIVTNKGKLIVSTDNNFKESSLQKANQKEEDENLAEYENEALLQEMNLRKLGLKILKNEDGETIVYLFCQIRNMNWFYIEKLHMETLLKQLTKRPEIKKSPDNDTETAQK